MQKTWIHFNIGNSKYTVSAVWIRDTFRHIFVAFESYILNSDEALNPKIGFNYWNRILFNCIKNNFISFSLFLFIYTWTWKKHMWTHKFWKCCDGSHVNIQWSLCPSFWQFSPSCPKWTSGQMHFGFGWQRKLNPTGEPPKILLARLSAGDTYNKGKQPPEGHQDYNITELWAGQKGESAPGYDFCHWLLQEMVMWAQFIRCSAVLQLWKWQTKSVTPERTVLAKLHC